MVFCNTLQLVAFWTRWTALISMFALTSVYYFHIIVLLNTVTSLHHPPTPRKIPFVFWMPEVLQTNPMTENLASEITLLFGSAISPLLFLNEASSPFWLKLTNCLLFYARKINAYLLRRIPGVQTAWLIPSELSLKGQWGVCWNSPKVALLCWSSWRAGGQGLPSCNLAEEQMWPSFFC